MKRFIGILIIAGAIISCKEQKPQEPAIEEPITEQKFAKFRIGVSKNTDLKKSFTVLAKAEAVEQLEILPAEDEAKAVAKIKLSDESIGYVKAKHLAGQPVVFTEDTKAFDRNNPTSRVKQTIPKGSIGFIVGESDNWKRIYVGKIDDTWVTDEWVEGGYEVNSDLLLEARDLEEARNTLLDEKAKDEAKSEALEKLEKLKSSPTIIAQVAQDFADELAAKGQEDIPETPDTDPDTEVVE
jgi:hypothetical protein